jgi:hypothetical protein
MASLVGLFSTVGNPGDIHTTQRNVLGTRARDSDNGNEYIYLVGVANTAAGDWVNFNSTAYQTIRLVKNAVGRVAIATAAVLATQYGWYLIKGFYTGALTDGAVLAAGAVFGVSAGAVSGSSSAGDLVNGANALAVDVGTLANVHISHPYVSDTAPA